MDFFAKIPMTGSTNLQCCESALVSIRTRIQLFFYLNADPDPGSQIYLKLAIDQEKYLQRYKL